MIGKFKIMKKIGNFIKNIASNKTLNKLVQPVATLGSMIPIAGPFVEKAIENAPTTIYEFGNALTGIGEGKKLTDVLHNYYNNTELIGNPLNMITIPNEGIRALREIIKK